jgi:hypothetical protein
MLGDKMIDEKGKQSHRSPLALSRDDVFQLTRQLVEQRRFTPL